MLGIIPNMHNSIVAQAAEAVKVVVKGKQECYERLHAKRALMALV